MDGKCICSCKCHHVPPNGNFEIGKEYQRKIGLDCAAFIDEDGKIIIFNEIEYLWYFSNTKDSKNGLH